MTCTKVSICYFYIHFYYHIEHRYSLFNESVKVTVEGWLGVTLRTFVMIHDKKLEVLFRLIPFFGCNLLSLTNKISDGSLEVYVLYTVRIIPVIKVGVLNSSSILRVRNVSKLDGNGVVFFFFIQNGIVFFFIQNGKLIRISHI